MGGGGGAKTDGEGGGAPGPRVGAGSSTAPLGAGATIVRSLLRRGMAGGAVVMAGTGPDVVRPGGKGMTPVVSDSATGGRSGGRWVSCGIGGAAAAPSGPRPGRGTAPSLSRTPATDGAGAAAGGARRGISVWQALHLSLAPPGGIRRSSMLYAAWQDGHVTRMDGSHGG